MEEECYKIFQVAIVATLLCVAPSVVDGMKTTRGRAVESPNALDLAENTDSCSAKVRTTHAAADSR